MVSSEFSSPISSTVYVPRGSHFACHEILLLLDNGSHIAVAEDNLLAPEKPDKVSRLNMDNRIPIATV